MHSVISGYYVCALTEHKKKMINPEESWAIYDCHSPHVITFEFVKDEMFAKCLEEWEELSTLKDREYIHLHRESR